MTPTFLRDRRRALLVALIILITAGTAAVIVRAQRGGPGGPDPDPAPAAAQETPTDAAHTPPGVAGLGSVSAAPGAGPSGNGPPIDPVGGQACGKKGVSTWAWSGTAGALADVRACWYYNWSSSPARTPGPAGVEFVPMIWGGSSVTDATLAQAKREGRTLLGFNEPDLSEQSNMSVEQALNLWPRLVATGLRLGSPVPAFGGDRAGGWLDRFMTGARQRGYRVDFIALHWYGSDFRAEAATGQLRSYIQAVWNRYRLPIWLTEYALINFSGGTKYPTADQQAAFVRSSTAMLQELSFVERYAWFSLPSTADAGTGLYRDGNTPTAAGAAYRAAG